MVEFKVGDYISYTHVSYNGGHRGYDRTTYYGCIIEKNEYKDSDISFNIIKQYGGQIWCVRPEFKIEEEIFLEKFSIYDEYFSELIRNKNKMTDKMREIVDNKYNEKIENVQTQVINYVNKKLINNCGKFSQETFYIEWYVYHVLRQYEPYKINQTLNFCYGASDELQDFMKKNVDFMIGMQFFKLEKDEIMPYFIEEKILEYKNSNGKLTDKDFLKKVFSIRVKKLENTLKFKMYNNYTIQVKISYEREKYLLTLNSNDLFDTKFVFKGKYGTRSNIYSKCYKKFIVNFQDPCWQKICGDKTKTQNTINYSPNDYTNIEYIKIIDNEPYEKKLLKVTDNKSNIVYEKIIEFSSINSPKFNDKYIYVKNRHKPGGEVFDLTNHKLIGIKHDSSHSLVYFDKSNRFLICQDTFSNSSCNNILTSIYELKNGNLLGFFEFNYCDFTSIFINEIILS